MSEIVCYKVGARSSRWIVQTGTGEWRYHLGYVVTAQGLVGVYTQHDYSELTFSRDGLEWRQRWSRELVGKALIREARSFAAAVAEGRL